MILHDKLKVMISPGLAALMAARSDPVGGVGRASPQLVTVKAAAWVTNRRSAASPSIPTSKTIINGRTCRVLNKTFILFVFIFHLME